MNGQTTKSLCWPVLWIYCTNGTSAIEGKSSTYLSNGLLYKGSDVHFKGPEGNRQRQQYIRSVCSLSILMRLMNDEMRMLVGQYFSCTTHIESIHIKLSSFFKLLHADGGNRIHCFDAIVSIRMCVESDRWHRCEWWLCKYWGLTLIFFLLLIFSSVNHWSTSSCCAVFHSKLNLSPMQSNEQLTNRKKTIRPSMEKNLPVSCDLPLFTVC